MTYDDYDPRRSLHRVLESAETIRQDGKLTHASAAWATQAANVHAMVYIGDQVGRLSQALQQQVHGPWPSPWATDELVWHAPEEGAHALVMLDRPDPEAPGWWFGHVLYARGTLTGPGAVLGAGEVVRLDESVPWNHRLDLGD